jgi:hypothetical protein
MASDDKIYCEPAVREKPEEHKRQPSCEVEIEKCPLQYPDFADHRRMLGAFPIEISGEQRLPAHSGATVPDFHRLPVTDATHISDASGSSFIRTARTPTRLEALSSAPRVHS